MHVSMGNFPDDALFSPYAGVLGEDVHMNQVVERPIRVMRIIARMNVGGPAVQVSGLMRGLSPKEFDHRLYTGYCAPDEEDYLYSSATDVTAIRIKGFGKHINLVGDMRAFLCLVRTIRQFKPHIIHTHTAKAGFVGRVASLVSFHKSIRVHTYHGHLLNGYFGTSRRFLLVKAEKILASFTDQILTVGDKVGKDLLHAGIGTREKYEVMPPGLSFGKVPSKNSSQEFLGLNTNRIQCALIGRVTQIKRPDRFLEVVSEMERRGANLDFFIAGDGDLLSKCQEQISNLGLSVKILGWQSCIERVLSAADIVLLTSDNEGMPLSLIQAGMAGIPVVATNVGSVSEVVLDDITGILTERHVREIADALEILINDEELRGKLGKAAQEFTLRNFSIERLVKDHEDLYRKLINIRAKIS